MKYLIALAMVAFLAVPALAVQKTPSQEPPVLGGFEGPVSGAQAETVEKAKKMAQDAPVVLTGHLVSRVAAEKNEYVFKDATGEIVVVITPKGFKGHTITPQNNIRLIGKVDKQASAPDAARIRVTRLELVN